MDDQQGPQNRMRLKRSLPHDPEDLLQQPQTEMEKTMNPLRRHPANKRQGAKTFRKHSSKTKAANMGLQRGGWRM